MAFLIGNPVLNPATLLFITFVLSWQFAVIRLVLGIALVLVIAWYANHAGELAAPFEGHAPSPAPIEGSASIAQMAVAWLRAFWWELYTIIPGYIVIVLALGAARAFLFTPALTLHSGSIVAIAIIAIVGTLFVIPTAGEVPIIQTLMGLGMGTAPALVLLLTLPTISLPTTYIVRKQFPARILAGTLAITAVVGFAAGAVSKVFTGG
jgi:uncharacterized membrane protein YraQ (UPF0718 family)